MENLSRSEFDSHINQKVKEELQIAGIPIVNIGRLDNEVKTNYIGILNGFVFIRSWSYWIVRGNMPLEYAQCLYDNHRDLNIRANGHAGNLPPTECAINKDFNKLISPYVRKWKNKEITLEELEKSGKEIEAQGKQVINLYHIDSQLGLCKFAEMIKNNNIITDVIEDEN